MKKRDVDGEQNYASCGWFHSFRGVAQLTGPVHGGRRRIDGSAKGYASQKGSRITLADSLTVADRAAVLIHEISHCLLHFSETKPNLKQRELEAEATAFVVASHFGLNPESKFYLASYGVKASELLESLPVIQTTAAQIISACATNSQQETAGVEMAAAASGDTGGGIDGNINWADLEHWPDPVFCKQTQW